MAVDVTFLLYITYGAFGLGTALLLPRLVPAVGSEIAIAYGLLVVVGTLTFHHFLMLQARLREMGEGLGGLYEGCRKVSGEVEHARGEMQAIHEALDRSVVGGANRRMENVMAEVRVLQQLVERLMPSATSGAARQLNGAATMAPPRSNGHMPADEKIHLAGDLDDTTVLDIVREGLSMGRVDLYLQPVVSLPQRKRRYYECFSRIRAENGMMILPEQFISLAEQEGLVGTIDNMLLFRCVQLVRKSRQRSRSVGVFCNISPNTLNDPQFFGDFVEFMSDNDMLSSNLYFEFSQATYAGMSLEARNYLRRLVNMGFRFSMDQVTDLDLDFADLQERGVRFIKVDAEALLAIDGQTEGGRIRALKSSLDRFGMDLIVEKVESEDVLLHFLDYQIDFGQGYLFGEPRLTRELA